MTDLPVRLEADDAFSSLTELNDAVKRARHFQAQSQAPNTKRAYQAAWKRYSDWCDRLGLEPLTEDPRQIGLYLAAAGDGLSAASLQVHLAAIGHAFRRAGYAFDARHPAIAEILTGIRRDQRARVKRQARPILPELLRRMVDVQPSTNTGLRNRALLLIGYGMAARRSELVSLDREHIAIESRGLAVTIPYAKTDQAGQGQLIGICAGADPSFCPLHAYRQWLEILGSVDHQSSGQPVGQGTPIFRRIRKGDQVTASRLSDQSVDLIIKGTVEATGNDAQGFSGHSLRSGLLSASRALGYDLGDAMNQSRHRSRDTAEGYVRHETIWERNVTHSVFT